MTCSIKNFSAYIEKHDFIFVLIFIATLPFKNSLSNIVLSSFILSGIILVLSKKRSYTFNFNSLRSTRFLIFIFIAYTISLLYSQNTAEGVKFVLKVIPLLLCPLGFSLLKLSAEEKRSICAWFVLSNAFAILINLSYSFWRSFDFVDNQLVFDASVAGGLEFRYSITQGGNYFFSDEFSNFLHPTYWSIQLLLCVFILVRNFTLKTKRLIIFIHASLIILFMMVIFLCSARIILLSLVLLLAIYLIFKTYKVKPLYLMISLFFLLMLSVVAMNNPRFDVFSSFSKTITYNNIRLASWHSSYEVFRSNFVFGTGVGDAEEELIKKYKELNYTENLLNRYNEHNQYLQISCTTGIFGLIVFLVALLYPILHNMQRKSYLDFVFLISISLVCMVENFLVRQAGVTFFSVFYCLFFSPDFRKDSIPETKIVFPSY